MNQSNSRLGFEEATGYNEVPKSAQDLLDLNAWPMWNQAWAKALPSVGPGVREAVDKFTTTVEFELTNFDSATTPAVLRQGLDLLNAAMTALEVQA